MGLVTADFDYYLPEELIAQHPAARRDQSRLLVYDRAKKSCEHRQFSHIADYLNPGDILVRNNTRVIPARLLGRREDTGGKLELLLLRDLGDDCWEALAKPAKRASMGRRFVFGDGALVAQVQGEGDDGLRRVRFAYDGALIEVLDRVGITPLPPYIHEKLADKDRYQTVYARQYGSAAAPTAGLHFTDELLAAIEQKGVQVADVLLHVGLGTFRPVALEELQNHRMHAEYYEVTPQAAQKINDARQRGGRVIAVGTTSARVLETVADQSGVIQPGRGETDIFIYPGYDFRGVDALITNFHLPRSTLLMMISALAGREEIMRVYALAVEEKYRFFSFGDAMLIV